MRFGLVGTGYWALETHARAIVETEGIELVSVWGRDAAKTLAAAERYSVEGFTDFEAFLDTVDAVSFAVPPHVQSELALRALDASKHVLLEKPISVTVEAADALVAAAEASGATSAVFFTLLYDARMRAIVADSATAGWSGGQGLWLGSALMDDNPFNTPWRHDKGGLWDLGPHAISVLWANLGPIIRVTADAGAADLVHLTLHHESGATSTASMTLRASDAADGFSTLLWGARGRQELPVDDVDEHLALCTALTELAAAARAGSAHPYGLEFGRDIVRVLAAAQADLDGRS